MVISVRDAADTIKLLGEVVKGTREIVKAMNDGALYLKRTYPDASARCPPVAITSRVAGTGNCASCRPCRSMRITPPSPSASR
jgi:hypothetical protein